MVENTVRLGLVDDIGDDETSAWLKVGDANQFWNILAEVYGENIGAAYLERLRFLHRNRLALWDVLRSAECSGSLDSGIKDGTANDFTRLVTSHTSLTAMIDISNRRTWSAENGGMKPPDDDQPTLF
jgi:hypothetical protein